MRTRQKIALCVAGMALLAPTAGGLRGQEAPEVRTRVLTAAQGSYLGVYISEVKNEAVDRLKLPEERGVLVAGVAEEGPAKEAGLQKDDVIVSWNGERVEGTAQLRRMLRETPPGRSVKLEVFRDGKTRTVDVKLGEGRGGFAAARAFEQANAEKLREEIERGGRHLDRERFRMKQLPGLRWMAFGGGRLGVTIQSLGEQLGGYFGLGDRKGVLVTEVREESPAEKAGLKAGDVILSVGGEEVESPSDMARIVRESAAGPASVKILRDRKERTLTVELPESNREGWTSEELESLMILPGEEDGDVRLQLHLPDLAPVWETLDTVLEGLEPVLEHGLELRLAPGAGPVEVIPGPVEVIPGPVEAIPGPPLPPARAI